MYPTVLDMPVLFKISVARCCTTAVHMQICNTEQPTNRIRSLPEEKFELHKGQFRSPSELKDCTLAGWMEATDRGRIMVNFGK